MISGKVLSIVEWDKHYILSKWLFVYSSGIFMYRLDSNLVLLRRQSVYKVFMHFLLFYTPRLVTQNAFPKVFIEFAFIYHRHRLPIWEKLVEGCFVFVMGDSDWLILWCLTPFSTVFQIYRGGECTYPCFPRVLLSSTPQNILSEPLAAFPHNHCRNNGQRWERNESCHNDYHQSSERILAEHGIEQSTSCSQVRNATDWAIGLGTGDSERYKTNCKPILRCRHTGHRFNVSSERLLVILVGQPETRTRPMLLQLISVSILVKAIASV